MESRLNPDPQGGESNMTDEQVVRQVYPDATQGDFTKKIYRDYYCFAPEAVGDSWADARAKLPEGAPKTLGIYILDSLGG